MTKKEVINEFVNDIENLIITTVKNNEGITPTAFFLVTDEEGQCDVIPKKIPATPTTLPESLEDMMKMMFIKFCWKQCFDEIQKDKKEILQFIHSELIENGDKKILVMMRKDFDEDIVIPKFYQVIENDITVSNDGELVPTSIELVEVGNP